MIWAVSPVAQGTTRAVSLIVRSLGSDTDTVRRAGSVAEPVELAQQLAGLLEAARSTRWNAGYVRVDLREVDRLVKQINRATGTSSHRDWRGRVTVSPATPLAAAANTASDAVAHTRRVPLSDDALLPTGRAADLAAKLRQAAT